MTCLDTTVLIDLLRSNQNQHNRGAQSRVAALWRSGNLLFTTRINVAELLVGAYRAADLAVEKSRIRRLLQPISILEFDAKSAEQFAAIKATTVKRGKPVGDADLLIAAIAQVNSCRLLTRNPRHFKDVIGLNVDSY